MGSKLSDYVKENIALSVVVDDAMELPDAKMFQKKLEKTPWAKSVNFIDKETALKELIEEIGENPEDLLGYNPALASFEVYLNAEYANADSMKLAEKMINLTGLTIKSKATPNGEIEIQYTGLRPGEKLYEELLIGDNVVETNHPMIMSANESYLPWDQLRAVLNQLATASQTGDCQQIRQILRDHVDGFNPQSEIVDLIYRQIQVG